MIFSMTRSTWALLSLVVSTASALNFSVPNVPATFSNTPQPFTLQVDPAFIADVRQRVADTRAPLFIQGSDDDGPGAANFTTIRDYWVNTYDWNAEQAWINNNLKQFTTVVQPTNSSFNSSVALHFVHHRSSRRDAIPLLFVHGWPGSFLEVSKIISHLTNPPNASLPAFHVVAPSIPGFAFSPLPSHTGFGPIEAAHTFDALMQQLNYTRYVTQGGDLGAFITRYQAHLYPQSLISLHTNFWATEPAPSDYSRLALNASTPDERAYIATISDFILNLSGYRFMHETFPLTIAYPTTDSPLGLALWIYSLIRDAVDPSDFAWNPRDIITFTMMHYIPGPYGGMRFYKEVKRSGGFVDFGFGALPYVGQPAAISEFPYDIWYRLPLDWAQREGNVKVRYVHEHGGHFAAYEVPDLLLGDVWRWFGDAGTSGTGVFRQT